VSGYWPRPWTAEDGGPLRHGAAPGGLALQPGERLRVAAVHDAYASCALVRREPGELFVLRHSAPLRGPQRAQVKVWVERLDPETLEVVASTPRLPAGPFWPGGIAAHANGDLHVVFGSWAHRVTPALEVVCSRELPAPRPHNSFVVLDGGQLVIKDCDAPAGLEPSTVCVLDPDTLEPLAESLRLPEPCIARLSSDGQSVVAIGTETAMRVRFDASAGTLSLDEAWRPRYGGRPDQGFGWDPVITDEHVLWMDNGRNATDRTMRDSGLDAGALRLWWARRDGAAGPWSIEVSGLAYGTISNPPGWDPHGGVVVAYDAGNAVLRAWRMEGDGLTPLWRRDDFAHAGHLIVFGETRELIAQDYRDAAWMRRRVLRRAARPVLPYVSLSKAARRASLRTGHDELVVADLDTGADKARVAVPSPSQGYLFPAPGFARDVYYQSLTTVARVVID
jgi:hypothetical protein